MKKTTTKRVYLNLKAEDEEALALASSLFEKKMGVKMGNSFLFRLSIRSLIEDLEDKNGA